MLSIMQPYIFPYIGYFHLLASADKFIVYDDVSYIKQGWINRNNILVNGQKYTFTIPLKNSSSFKLINDTYIDESKYERWLGSFYKTVEQSYKKSPFFYEAISVVSEVFSAPNAMSEPVSVMATRSITAIARYLSLPTIIQETSSIYQNADLKSQERVIDICLQERATDYINPIGGNSLYRKEDFKERGIDLFFIKSLNSEYNQNSQSFVPWLSIIDVLMFNEREVIHSLLQKYEVF